MKTLQVRPPGSSVVVLRMAWDEGAARIEAADPLILPDVERWLSRGLMELIREPDGIRLTHRTTTQDDPLFLDRIAESLQRQFKFECEVAG